MIKYRIHKADSIFAYKYICKLEYGIHVFHVLDYLIICNKEKGFNELLKNSLRVFENCEEVNLLNLFLNKTYENSNCSFEIENYLNQKEFCKIKQNQIMFMNINSMKKLTIKLFRSRDNDVKANLSAIKCEETIKSNNEVYHLKDIQQMAVNARSYLSDRVCLHTFIDYNSNLIPGVSVEFKHNSKYIENGYGRGDTYQDAYNIALLEAVERYASQFYAFKNDNIYGSYNDYEKLAVHPSAFILPSSKDNTYSKYTDELKIYWTEAYSIRYKRKVLVPEQLVYFADSFFRDKKKMNRFIYDSSSGVALGGSFTEAIFHGILELIERDNFLTTWYGNIKGNKVNIDSLLQDKKLKKLLRQANKQGIEISLFDISMELGIPVFWALSINDKENSYMYSYSAAGCNPNAERAAKTAIFESLVGFIVKNENNKKFGIPNITKVEKYLDHVDYYSRKSSSEIFSFILNKATQQNYKYKNEYVNKSLNADLALLYEKVLTYYDDIYIANLTSKEMQKYGLYVTKVIIPGMLPMTFGSQNERYCADRIIKELKRKGLEKVKVHNLSPHPFP